MIENTFVNFKDAPATVGVFNLLDENNQSLYVGAGENIKIELKRILASNQILKSQTQSIETIISAEENLLKNLAETIYRKSPLYSFNLHQHDIYPHLKLTNEEFPRLLATRRIEDDGADYFGAFMPKTGARYLLGFLIDTFRLRGCDIPIDGKLAVPCPQFYRKKCLAPCVENLCDAAKYCESVDLTRLFLRNRQAELNELLQKNIEDCSDKFEFEAAARWHKLWQKTNDFLKDKNSIYTLSDAKDAFDIKTQENGFLIYLITQRSRKILGRHTFIAENKIGFSGREVLGQLVWQLYRFYAPKEIGVPIDFPNRQLLEKILSERENRTIKISVLKKTKQKITINRALRRAEFEYAVENLKPPPSLEDLQDEFKKIFSLTGEINRIEAFDVAHISGSDFVGAQSVWEKGKLRAEEYKFWFSVEKNEPGALSEAVKKRFAQAGNLPDLILIDGGRTQLHAVTKNVEQLADSKIFVVSAVKPPQKHHEISRFLLQNGQTVEFEKNSDVFNLLLKLRDEAHALANYIHRSKRETAHFYEVFQNLPTLNETERYLLLRKFGSLKAVKTATQNELTEILGQRSGEFIYRRLNEEFVLTEPFIVPIRYDEPNGEASDLQPLYTAKIQTQQ